MSTAIAEKRSWSETFKAWSHPRVITMLFLGFSAGLPLALIFSTLGLWLLEAGVTKSSVTFFSWAALGYSFKFVWAPLIDKIPFPILTKMLGKRRSWMLVSQFSIIIAIASMAMIDPSTSKESLTLMALAAVLLGFSSATQDIVIDAYRIESIDESYQALLASTFVAGYRLGMIVTGAGALYLASYFGTTKTLYLYGAWKNTYLIASAFMLVGIVTTLIIHEPDKNKAQSVYSYSNQDYFRLFIAFIFCCVAFASTFFYSSDLTDSIKIGFSTVLDKRLVGFFIETLRLFAALGSGVIVAYLFVLSHFLNRKLVIEAYVEPVRDFFSRYGRYVAILLLLLVGFYRVSDIVLGVIANVFYTEIGFTKNAIATVSKTYGIVMIIVGSLLGGFLTLRYGIYRILFLGAVLSSATNLLFMLLAERGADIVLLIVVISIDNLSAGIASIAFIAFLSSLVNISFTATQYAIFTSLMTLFPKLLGGYSGTIVESTSYSSFFLLTTLMGIPVLFLIWLASRVMETRSTSDAPI